MLQFPSTVPRTHDEVCGIFLAKDSERLVKPPLLDEAVPREISTGRIPRDQVLLREEALRPGIVPCGEMDLREPECILVIFCEVSALGQNAKTGKQRTGQG